METTNSPSFVSWREVRVYGTVLTPTRTATPTPQPIGIDELQTRSFSGPGDVNWAVFYATTGGAGTVRAWAGTGVDPDMTLYAGMSIAAYNDNYCAPTYPFDPLITYTFTPGTYYVKLTNKGSTAGSFDLKVRSSMAGCSTAKTASVQDQSNG